MALIVQVQKCISCKNVQQMQKYELWTWSETLTMHQTWNFSFFRNYGCAFIVFVQIKNIHDQILFYVAKIA